MTMKPILGTAFAALLAAPAFAGGHLSEAESAAITAALAEMQCEMDLGDVEKEDEGYELDDVFCADGQYDMEMDKEFKVTNKRKE